MLTLMILMSLIVTVVVNVASSCYVCYHVAVDPDTPVPTLVTVTGVVLLNAIIPFTFGCLVGMWYIL